MNIFSEDKVVLELSREDFDKMILILGMGIGAISYHNPKDYQWAFDLVNRINEGNPRWIPYHKTESESFE